MPGRLAAVHLPDAGISDARVAPQDVVGAVAVVRGAVINKSSLEARSLFRLTPVAK
jgi:hypothetical protein